MRVNADLDALDSELTEAARFRLANHGGVGLHLDVKEQTARVFDQFKKVAAEEHFAAAERQEKDASVRELIEDGLDLRGRHFAVVVVIEVAMNAALVAPVGEIEMSGEWNARIEGPLRHFLNESHRAGSRRAADSMGWSETRRMPCCESSSTKRSESWRAWSLVTSNSWQTVFCTMSSSGVLPS